MFHVYYTNHGYTASETFNTVEAAKAYGKSKGFEFTVYRADQDHHTFRDYREWMASWTRVGHWTQSGGWRTA